MVENDEPLYPSPMYEKAATDLLKKVNKASTLAEIRILFNDFRKKYTVIKFLWIQWLRKERDENYIDFQLSQCRFECKKVLTFAKSHFYFIGFVNFDYDAFTGGRFGRSYRWSNLNKPSATICKIPSKSEPFIVERLFYPTLVYPHDLLEEFMLFTEKYSTQNILPVISKNYKKAKMLYDESLAVRASQSDKLAGLKFFQEMKIDKMIMFENYECLIGRFSNYSNKKLWRLYIDYVKSQEEEERLLNLYSRYCRLLINFPEAQKEYRIELERQSLADRDVERWWIDTIEFEKDMVGIDTARKVLDKALENSSQELLVKYGLWFEKEYGDEEKFVTRYTWCLKLFPKFQHLTSFPKVGLTVRAAIQFDHQICGTYKQFRRELSKRIVKRETAQSFAFPFFIISYLLKNANPPETIKLFQSAKYFFWRRKSPLCHNLTILEGAKDKPIFYPTSLFITSNHIDFLGKFNYTVTNTLIIYSKNDSNIFSKLLPKFELRIKHLILTSQELSSSEFSVLTKLELKSIKMDEVVVKKKCDILFSVEEIISVFTVANDISILNGFYTPQTSCKLSHLHKNVKLTNLELSEVDEYFKVLEFAEFIKKNATNDASITICFSSNVPAEQKDAFENSFRAEIPNTTFKMN